MTKLYTQLLALCALTVTSNAFVTTPSPSSSLSRSLKAVSENAVGTSTNTNNFEQQQFLEQKQEAQLQREINDLKAQVGNLKDMRQELTKGMPTATPFVPRQAPRRVPRRDIPPEPRLDADRPVTVQGGSLRTWAFTTTAISRVKLALGTEGRPLNARVELWQGPGNTPQVMDIYNEDGSDRPFSCIMETPRGVQNSVAVRNTAMLEFPLTARLEAEVGDGPLGLEVTGLARASYGKTIQGGAISTYPFEPAVSSVGVLLQTEGRPLNARIELLQGPSNTKQIVDLYSEDGLDRPFYSVIETPGPVGTVVRVINTSSMEFPLRATVEPYSMDEFVGASGGVGAGSYFSMM